MKRPVSALLIVLALAVFGISSVFGFRLELTPDMEMPMLMVMTVYQGGDPETTQELVTKVIEDAGKKLSGVDSIKSQSTADYSVVLFSYDYGVNTKDTYTDLRSALDTASLQLPEDAKDPVILEMNMNAMDMMMLSVTSTGDVDVLSFVEKEIKPELERIADIAEVTITGGASEYVSVTLHKEKLQQYGLTMASIAQYIMTTDFTIPVGKVEQGRQGISTSASSKPETLTDLRNTALITNRGQVIRLSDVATVSMATKKSDSISRHNGSESISVAIAKAQSAGTVNVAKRVKSVIEKAAAKNPSIQIDISYNAADSIISSLSSVAKTLVLGVVFSMLVLFIFFGDFKASLIVGSSMPISLFSTLIFMSFAGFTLNIVTMGALVISIGMMVDASIVVLESCFRLKDEKPDFREAAIAGTKVVASSVAASTITTVVVYLPLSLMKGLAGQIFSELGYTIIIAMLSSLIVAVTLIPIFFWKYRPKEKKSILANRILKRIGSGYKRLLPKIMHKKKTVMLVAVALLAAALWFAAQLNRELMMATGIDHISIKIEQRSGTRIEVLDEDIQFIEQMIMDDEDFKSNNLTISGYTATIDAYPSPTCTKSISELVDKYNQILKDYANMNVAVEAGGSGMTSMISVGSTTQVDLSGGDLDDLRVATKKVEAIMLGIPGVLKASSSLGSDASQAKIKIDSLKCMDVGLTPVQVAGEMYSANSGKEAMKMNIGVNEYSVMLEYPEGTYSDMNDLLHLEIQTGRGGTLAVSDVAEAVYSDAPETLVRNDGKYQVTITAYTTDASKFIAQNAINAAVAEAIENGEFPESVNKTDSMMLEMMMEEFIAIGKAIAAAVFLIFLVMAMQFESPRFSIMVMLSIPFSLIGSFFLLYITGSTLNMTSLMGVLMLVGIVVNNGILYVDTANQLQETMSIDDSLMESGSIRLRPILMTTLTTILSMVPMLFAKDENSAMMRGMSLIIIGGLITSTLLILLLLPSFYLLMSKQGRAEARERKKRKKEEKAENKKGK